MNEPINSRPRGLGTTCLLASLVVVLIAGCQEKTEKQAGGTTAGASEPAPMTATTGTAGRDGDSPGKPTPPIRIDYEVIGEPRAGEPLEVDLKISTELEGPLEVTLQPQEGLQMGATQEPMLLRESSLARLEPMAERVVVVPPGDGRFYLSVLVAVATPAGQQMRAVSIPIQVGDKPPTLRPNGELTTTPDGESVISLPATEPDSD